MAEEEGWREREEWSVRSTSAVRPRPTPGAATTWLRALSNGWQLCCSLDKTSPRTTRFQLVQAKAKHLSWKSRGDRTRTHYAPGTPRGRVAMVESLAVEERREPAEGLSRELGLTLQRRSSGFVLKDRTLTNLIVLQLRTRCERWHPRPFLPEILLLPGKPSPPLRDAWTDSLRHGRTPIHSHHTRLISTCGGVS